MVDVQLEYSLASRGIEQTIAPTLAELGIGLTASGVLSRGLLAGSTPKGANDFRAHLPRFSDDSLSANRRLAAALTALARRRGATAAQLAIAWVLSRGAHIVPLVGARSRSQLDESLGALQLILTAEDLAAIESAVPTQAVAGTRYDAHQMAILDSERAPVSTY